MVSHLEGICQQENIKADREALHIIAQKADGELRDALSIFDRMTSFAGKEITYDSVIENLNVLDYDYYFKVVEAMTTENISQVLLIFDEIFKKGFEPDIFINGLAEHLRNLLVCKDTQTLQLLELSDSLKKQYQAQASIVPSSFLLTALNIANDCDVNYKMARHKRLHVEMAIIKMTYIGRAITLANTPPAPAIEKKRPDQDEEIGVRSQESGVRNVASPNTDASSTSELGIRSQESGIKEASEEAQIIVEPIAPAAIENVPVTKAPPTVDSNEEPSPQTQKIPATPEPANKNGSLKLGKATKYDLPSLANLATVEEEEEVIEVNSKLEEASLQIAWEAFLPQIESPSVKECFKGAVVQLKDEQSIIIEVGSQMSKQMIQQEKELVPYLRKQLRFPRLQVEIKIDQAKAQQLVKPKKLLTVKEKYIMMREKNPLIDDLSRRLGLKPDNG